MTSTEVEEHRSKNLCFFCHEKFLPGHNCQQCQRGQIFLMEMEEDTMIRTQEPIVILEKEPVKDKEPVGEVSLNTLCELKG